MLTIYKRHLQTCKHRSKGRAHRTCRCPLWTDGIFEGVEIRQSLRVHTWDEAEIELQKLKERIAHPGAADKRITLSHAWEKFTDDAKNRSLTDATLRKYKYLRTEMENFAAARGLRFIREFDLEQLGDWRSTWKNKNVAALKKLEFVRCFLRFAHDRGWVEENFARKLRSPKVMASPTLPFDAQEMVLILAAVDGCGAASSRARRRMRALILLLRHSGLRIGDAVSLSKERLHGDKLFLRTLKTGTDVYCPLPPFVVTALDAALDPGQRFYFWTGNGKVQTITGDWQAKLKDLFERAKVKKGHAHRFRDTFAVELLQAGVPMDRVSILLGHSSIRITERHYNAWVKSRQEQLERDVRAAWGTATPELSAEGTPEVHGGSGRPN
jgi:integrase/recombinase XerD